MNFRYTPLLVGLLIGITLGLFYGWVIRPLNSGETAPHSLQQQYRADMVLMVAEIFAAEEDIEMARQRMITIGFKPYAELVVNALHFAKAHDFSDQDIELLINLSTQLDLVTPQPETNQP
ncbi:MAG: hypothetical protein A2Z14_14145 [Chloroflexi bacterium RBG_16_48_8]|nr:MAG: hypothetical protein A2Z14_14145 [Chloroflexi bacterium RBG_16_48_8]